MKSKLSFHLKLPEFAQPVYQAVLNEFGWNKGFNIEFKSEGIEVGPDTEADFQVSTNFLDQLEAMQLDWRAVFGMDSPAIKLENGKIDPLSTALYMLFSGQEYGDFTADTYGRFPYSSSYQAHFKIPQENIVQDLFDAMAMHHAVSECTEIQERENRVFLSHDNDQFHQSWKEDGFWALKRGKIAAFLKIQFLHLFGKPVWRNMGEIMDLEADLGKRSTFFWLVEKENTPEGFTNSDYTFQSKAVQNIFANIEERGWNNGLHKSLLSKSFEEEMAQFPHPPKANRNHFLGIRIPETFQEMEKAGIRFDSSLGFAEEIGFRNSYGLPYQVFDFKKNQSLNLIELPLHIMDAGLRTYGKLNPAQAEEKILSFLKKHPKNTWFAILWHNKFFSPYKFNGWKDVYINTLKECADHASIQPGDVLRHHPIE